jgi:hypothetical protein
MTREGVALHRCQQPDAARANRPQSFVSDGAPEYGTPAAGPGSATGGKCIGIRADGTDQHHARIGEEHGC